MIQGNIRIVDVIWCNMYLVMNDICFFNCSTLLADFAHHSNGVHICISTVSPLWRCIELFCEFLHLLFTSFQWSIPETFFHLLVLVIFNHILFAMIVALFPTLHAYAGQLLLFVRSSIPLHKYFYLHLSSHEKRNV